MLHHFAQSQKMMPELNCEVFLLQNLPGLGLHNSSFPPDPSCEQTICAQAKGEFSKQARNCVSKCDLAVLSVRTKADST